MRRKSSVGPGIALAGLLGLLATRAAATEELADGNGLVCTACHDKPGSKRLTDRGKYFETMRTLDGYDEIVGTFGECTRCHAREPGSQRLTDYGRRLAAVAIDMDELLAWVRANHPTSSDAGDSLGGADGE